MSCVGCGWDCTGSCAGDCGGDCGDYCDGSCSGSCDGGCKGSCKNYCNTACSAANAAQVISEIGNLIVVGKLITSADILKLKSTLQQEFIRRGRSDYSVYSTQPNTNTVIRAEHGQKILDDCMKLGATGWSNLITPNTRIIATPLTNACQYTAMLMNTVVPKP